MNIAYVYFATGLVFKWLNRRSQRRSLTWKRFGEIIRPLLAPSPKVFSRRRTFHLERRGRNDMRQLETVLKQKGEQVVQLRTVIEKLDSQ